MQTLPTSFEYSAETYRRQLLADAEKVRNKRPIADAPIDMTGRPNPMLRIISWLFGRTPARPEAEAPG